MNGHLAWFDGLFGTGFFNGALCQNRSFCTGDHPTDHIPAVDIEDDAQAIVGPLGGPDKFGDIPGPYVVLAGGVQLGSCIIRPKGLIPVFTNLVVVGKNSAHGSGQAEAGAFVKKSRINGFGGGIYKAFRKNEIKDCLAFCMPQCSRVVLQRAVFGFSLPFLVGQTRSPVKGVTGECQSLTEDFDAHGFGQPFDDFHNLGSLEGDPRNLGAGWGDIND